MRQHPWYSISIIHQNKFAQSQTFYGYRINYSCKLFLSMYIFIIRQCVYCICIAMETGRRDIYSQLALSPPHHMRTHMYEWNVNIWQT